MLSLPIGAFGIDRPGLRSEKSVVRLHHGHGESSRSNLSARLRQCMGRRGPLVVQYLSGPDSLVRNALADVFVHTVVADVAAACSAVALGINEAVVVLHTRQQRGSCLVAVFARQSQLGERRLELWTVRLGSD